MNRVVSDICHLPWDSFSVLLCQVPCTEGFLIIKWLQWSFLDMSFAFFLGYSSACPRGPFLSTRGARMGTIHGLSNRAGLSSASAACSTAELYAESLRWQYSLGTTWEQVDYIRLSHYQGAMLCLHRDGHNTDGNHPSSLVTAILPTLSLTECLINLHIIPHTIISDQRYILRQRKCSISGHRRLITFPNLSTFWCSHSRWYML